MNYSGVYSKKPLEVDSPQINVNINVNNNVGFHMKARNNTGISAPSPINAIFKTVRYGKREIALLINTPVCVQRTGKDRRIMVYGAHEEKLTQLHFYQVCILLEFFTISKSDAFLTDYLTHVSKVTGNKINIVKNCPPVGFEFTTS